MSVSRDYTPHTYSGDGAQTAFPVRWVFHDPAWVRAQRIVGGVVTDLANGTDYTVQQGADVGGTLTLVAPLAVGAKLLIWRDVPFEQLDRYANTGLFDVRVVERGMDRLTVMAQQLREAVGRCVKVRMDSTTAPDQIMGDINSALAGAQASAGAAAGSATAAGAAKDGAEVARAGAEAAKVGAEQFFSDVTGGGGSVPVAKGGTGATTVEGARAALGILAPDVGDMWWAHLTPSANQQIAANTVATIAGDAVTWLHHPPAGHGDVIRIQGGAFTVVIPKDGSYLIEFELRAYSGGAGAYAYAQIAFAGGNVITHSRSWANIQSHNSMRPRIVGSMLAGQNLVVQVGTGQLTDLIRGIDARCLVQRIK